MRERNLSVLASPAFLVSLLLLLFNDFLFKAQFHNGLTGKLSDFAGLFVFPLFWAAFFPRLKSLIYVLTAVLFIFWKSVYSQPLIEGWNNLPYFPIERTVDDTDLAALIMLPLSYAYSNLPCNFRASRPALYSIAVVSMFAFTATSYSKTVSYNNEYQFQISKAALVKRMSLLPVYDMHDPSEKAETFVISFDSCTGSANVTIHEKDNQSVVTLKKMNYRCPSEPDRQEMLQHFEREFIDKLREEPVKKSSQVQSIWSTSPPSNNRSQPTPRQHDPRNSSPHR